MKKTITTLLIVITTTLYSQNIDWETNLGGSANEFSKSITNTADGGSIIAGSSTSSNGDVGGNNGQPDFWIVKLDTNGSLMWETNLGGTNLDKANVITQTTDGGYMVAGSSLSSNGDVSGTNNGLEDFWIVKLDTNGTLVWETNLGGGSDDRANALTQATDGGYIVAGTSSSTNGDVGGNNGFDDFWIVKLDTNGTLIWESNLGGSSSDKAYAVTQAIGGGYIVSGFTSSIDGDVSSNNGGNDFWIVKIDENGNLVWETNFGGSLNDYAFSVTNTTDGAYIIAGHTYSTDGDISGTNNGNNDFWIVKIDASGDLLWETNLGGSGPDSAFSVVNTSGGGYLVAGGSFSANGDVGGNNGAWDYWIVKLAANGDLVWETNLGGFENDTAKSITQVTDGGYVVLGDSYSSDGDVGANNGESDYWVVKLEEILGTEDHIASKINLFPNPAITTFTIANLTEAISEIEIIDLQGRKVLSQSNLVNNTINISNLQAATYIVKIHVGKMIYYKKVVKK